MVGADPAHGRRQSLVCAGQESEHAPARGHVTEDASLEAEPRKGSTMEKFVEPSSRETDRARSHTQSGETLPTQPAQSAGPPTAPTLRTRERDLRRREPDVIRQLRATPNIDAPAEAARQSLSHVRGDSPTRSRTELSVNGHRFLPGGGHDDCPVVVMRSARWRPWGSEPPSSSAARAPVDTQKDNRALSRSERTTLNSASNRPSGMLRGDRSGIF